MPGRDHIFISYAGEDFLLAEWLTLRLTALGYAVWCDSVKLLGGESYPKDIDYAIKDRTFRVVALLSRSSLHKPNPVKERTLALNLAKTRGEDFLIPLNIDGLAASELDWMTSDLTFIPFEDWGDGLERLIKRFESISVPRPLTDGPMSVRDYFRRADLVSDEPERIWSNLLPIVRIPPVLRKYRVATTTNAWPHVMASADTAWAFEPPDERLRAVAEIDWSSQSADERRGIDVVSWLLRQYMEQLCVSRGLRRTARGDVYFPRGLLAGDKLTFTDVSGRKSWVLAAGARTFIGSGIRETNRYHLAPGFKPRLWTYGAPALEVKLRLHLSDIDGKALEPRRAFRRGRKVRKSWFNHQWRCRIMGTLSWLSNGESEFTLGAATDPIVVASQPLSMMANRKLEEAAIRASNGESVFDEEESKEELELFDDEEDDYGI